MNQNRRSFLNFVRQRNARPDDTWLHVNRTAMACRFEVTLPGSEQSGVLAATEALDVVDTLIKGEQHLRSLGPEYLPRIGISGSIPRQW